MINCNPVSAFTSRISTIDSWLPIDHFGYTGDVNLQQDSSKFSYATFCNILNEDINIHIAVFKRSTYVNNYTTEIPASNVMAFLNYNLLIPAGTTHVIENFYIDNLWNSGNAFEEQPIVCVWAKRPAQWTEPTGILDIIIRR